MIPYFGGSKDQESISIGKDVVARTLTIQLIQQNYNAISKLYEEGNNMIVIDKQSITAYKS